MPTAPDLRWGLRQPQAPAPSLFPRDDAAPPPKSLVERHRPKTLSEVVGQGLVVRRLMEYVDFPCPQIFLFSGPTGTGKSSAARALANDLRVHPTAGLHVLNSGRQNADALESIETEFRFAPMWGWRLVLAEEADSMSAKAEQVWLSIMEELPPMTTVVFTTNNPKKLDQRFRDRTQHMEFTADPGTLMPDLSELVSRVWRAEGCQGPPPSPESTGAVADGQVSFRRAVAGLEPLVRAARSKPAPARADAASYTRQSDGSFRRPAPAPAPEASGHVRYRIA